MSIPTLGEPRFISSRSHTVSDEIRIPERIEIGAELGLQFELAGPRKRLFFHPKQTRAGIVTCGGLCPGLNDVIRGLVIEPALGLRGRARSSGSATGTRGSRTTAAISRWS